MEVKVGDFYIRHSDGQTCRVKWIDRATVVLELGDERHLSLTNIFALEKAIRRIKIEQRYIYLSKFFSLIDNRSGNKVIDKGRIFSGIKSKSKEAQSIAIFTMNNVTGLSAKGKHDQGHEGTGD